MSVQPTTEAVTRYVQTQMDHSSAAAILDTHLPAMEGLAMVNIQ